jgi:3-oxocholest-4-en-26-oyl-CoA dehydrogenase alpha subunit
MDFSLIPDSPEIKAFRADVQAWVAEKMREGEGLHWRAGWSTREDEREYEFRRELGRALGAKGWLFPMFPVEYGGLGLSIDHQLVIAAELARYGLSLDRVFYTLARLVAPCMLQWGTEEQKQTFLTPLLRAEVTCWQLLTEPQGGSDLATCRTYAVRDGDHYVVNGQKTMVGSTHTPDFVWTIVNTAPDKPRHQNLSWLYIPGNALGITYQPLYLMMGRKNTVFFDNVRVPAFNLVGGENNGWKVAHTHLELEHGGEGGVTDYCLVERLVEYCRDMKINDVPLLEDDRVRDTLADMYIELHAVRLLSQRNFFFRYIREPHPYGGVQFRYYHRMVRLRNSARLQQILGYDSLIPNLEVNEEDDFEYSVRSGPGMLHGGGTLDTDRLIFARRLGLGRPRAEAPPVTV